MPLDPPPAWITELEDEALASIYDSPFGPTGRHPEQPMLQQRHLTPEVCPQCGHRHHMHPCAVCTCPGLPSTSALPYEGSPL